MPVGVLNTGAPPEQALPIAPGPTQLPVPAGARMQGQELINMLQQQPDLAPNPFMEQRAGAPPEVPTAPIRGAPRLDQGLQEFELPRDKRPSLASPAKDSTYATHCSTTKEDTTTTHLRWHSSYS